MRTYCERKRGRKTDYDKRSFRWKLLPGGTRLLIACRRGKWNATKERCREGTRAYAILKPATGRCPTGSTRIAKN